jgi:alcohol dehydrogenase class IV
MIRLDFATASRIVFACGAVREAPKLIRDLGRSALIVTGKSVERASSLLSMLAAEGVNAVRFPVPGEPTLDDVRAGASAARDRRCDVVSGFGGGSAIDAAKATAILAANSGEPLDYLEVVGRGLPFEKAPLPWVAVPTTAGTGAEVTRNAVVLAPEQGVKASLRSAAMLAKVAVVDPELTLDLPPDVTAYTGLDALTQLIEPFVSCRANAMVDGFCIEGMRRVSSSLEKAFRDGRDVAARDSMAFASLLGGLALANAGLGVVHGFAAPLGGMLKAPHGAICAALLPYGVAANIRALRERQPDGDVLLKYREVARLLTGRAEIDDLPRWLRDFTRGLGTRSLSELGLKRENFPDVVPAAAQASSMKANPLPLTAEELTRVLDEATGSFAFSKTPA